LQSLFARCFLEKVCFEYQYLIATARFFNHYTDPNASRGNKIECIQHNRKLWVLEKFFCRKALYYFECVKAMEAGLLIKNFHSTLISAYINFTATAPMLMQYKKEVIAVSKVTHLHEIAQHVLKSTKLLLHNNKEYNISKYRETKQ
jgi:hypothetical protein